MTSNNSKTVTNEATGPNSSSEESERRGRNKPHQKITLPIWIPTQKNTTFGENNIISGRRQLRLRQNTEDK